MSKIKTALKLLRTPQKMILPFADMGFFIWMSDEMYLKFAYRCIMGKKLNLKEPRKFTEKLQWLKLHDRKKIYIEMVDKIKVKKYVGKKIGFEYIIPTIDSWDSVDQIDFDSLPNKFVLKCNHDSGSIIKCYDKESFDINSAKKQLKLSLNKNSFWWGREWPYKFVKRKILAEEFVQDNNEELIDYKIYCFNGLPKYCQVIMNRSSYETIDFYDMDWNLQPFVGMTPSVKNSKVKINAPDNYLKMQQFAKILSKDTYFCRVDFYDVNKRLFFGEITFYPNSGFGTIYPKEWDDILGKLIII